MGPEGEGQIGLLARKPWRDLTVAAPPGEEILLEEPAEKSWLIFADTSGLGDKLASATARQRASDAGSHIAIPTLLANGKDGFTLRAEVLEDWKNLLRACALDDPPVRLVYLWSLDTPRPTGAGDAELMGTDALLHLIQALEEIKPSTKSRLDLVTRGAQPAGRAMNGVAVEQTPLVGLLRVILNEYPNITGRVIDLPPDDSISDQSLLWSELLREDTEREIAFRGEARYVQRLARGRPSQEEWLDPELPLRLESRERGHLDTLRFVPFALPACEARPGVD